MFQILRRIWHYKSFSKFYLTTQIVFIILFGTLVEYDDDAKGSDSPPEIDSGKDKTISHIQYVKFQDVHVMVVFGIGFLYTFLERLTHCGSGYTLYVVVLCAQIHLLVNGWLYWNQSTTKCATVDSDKFHLTSRTTMQLNEHWLNKTDVDLILVRGDTAKSRALQSLFVNNIQSVALKNGDALDENLRVQLGGASGNNYFKLFQIREKRVETIPVLEKDRNSVKLTLKTLIDADAGVFAVLISYGAVLGVVSPLQLTAMGIIEIILYSINAYVCQHHLAAVDEGGSILVHVFGAYFGLSVSRLLYKRYLRGNMKYKSSKESNSFALLGMAFLWAMWPSFNARNLTGSDQTVALANTRWSIAGSAIGSIAMSQFLSGFGELDMFHVQEACLAGGVAMGALANAYIAPWAAILIGVLAGMTTAHAQEYFVPLMRKFLKIHDSRGVHSLHGLAGLMGGIASGIFPAFAHWYPNSEVTMVTYPAMNPAMNEYNCLLDVKKFGLGLSGSQQAGRQFEAIVVTLAIAIIGGAITGLILRLPIWERPDETRVFDDEDYWVLQGESEKYQRFMQRMLNRFLGKPHTEAVNINLDFLIQEG